MFKSFFPNPRLLFLSASAWGLLCVLFWFFAAQSWGQYIGLPDPAQGTPEVIGPGALITAPHIWFNIFFWICVVIFAAVWYKLSPHRWFAWSVLGSALLVFVTYFQVQISVAINSWYSGYYDLIQKALSPETKGTVPIADLYSGLIEFVGILAVWIVVAILLSFYTSHYTFRWRTAMNEFYVANWGKLRKVEGASQRVQEDTMRLARLVEDLGVSFINSIMTLIAFLPILATLSAKITEVPLFGVLPYSLVWVSLIWSFFGTALLAIIGIRLPGLEFKKQRVEAAYRKELVFGEDYADRAQPLTLLELFEGVRKNYYSLFANYLYFNFGRYMYLQADVVISLLVLLPSIAAGTITFGFFQQVRNAMGEVKEAMQYLVRSWPSIIELISIYKRLRIFESAVDGKELIEDQIKADEAYGASST
jgi:peptide/bleomycin uptake transporter